MNIFWHRRDLRTTDNVGLAHASSADKVVPVFIFDPAVMTHASPPRMAFLIESVRALQGWYRDRGGDLLIRRGDPTSILPTLALEHDVDMVTWNRDYSGLARRRDAAVRRALADAQVERQALDDAVFHPPGEILTNQGDPYAVYTYFWRKWRDREKPQALAAPSGGQLQQLDGVPTPIWRNWASTHPKLRSPMRAWVQRQRDWRASARRRSTDMSRIGTTRPVRAHPGYQSISSMGRWAYERCMQPQSRR